MYRSSLTIIYRNLFRGIATLNLAKNDPSGMKILTSKQLGKIAGDVSKCANSDIKIWNSFVDSCQEKAELCDSKDILRIVRAINTFYRFYSYEIRERDRPLVEAILDKVIKYCEAYNCGELGEISEIFADLANHNTFVLQDVFTLLSKISITFNLRLAEAVPIDVLKLSSSFSKLGIHDNVLFGVLVNFACNGGAGFRLEDHRILLTSCAIVGYYNEKLLEIVLNGYSKCKSVTPNDLGILSFAFSKLGYKNDSVKQFFYKYQVDDIEFVDIPSFCANLHKLDVKVPENIVKRINVKELPADLFFDIVPLLANSTFKVELVMDKYLEFIKDSTFDNHVKILEYVVGSKFTESLQKLFNTCIPHVVEGLSAVYTSADSGSLYELSIDKFKTLELLTRIPCHWLSDYVERFGTICESVPLEYKSQFITLLFGLHAFLDSLPSAELTLGMEKHFGLSIQEALSEIIAQENVNRAPYTLCAEIKELLGNNVEVGYKVGVVTLLGRVSDKLIFPVFPTDFVSVENYNSRHDWVPPGMIPRPQVLISLIYLSNLGHVVVPVSYHQWRSLDKSKWANRFL